MKTLTAIVAALGLLAVPRAAHAQVQTRVLQAFSGDDGAMPSALVEAGDGTFYGTAWGGGDAGLGTVFHMTPNGSTTVLHSFAGGSDGAHPTGVLLQLADGNFYGTTEAGGDSSLGTLFRMTPAGAVEIVHAFAGGPTDGSVPGNLLLAADGTLYGTAVGGGPSGNGIVYRMAQDDSLAVVYAFTGGLDGSRPGGLMQSAEGMFYGGSSGGAHNAGNIFSLTADGTLSVVHAFAGGVEGSSPGGLAQGLDGDFYGTTISGGTSRLGSVFRMTPSGVVTTIHSFVGSPVGAYPGGLIRGTDGMFYGTTISGGRAFTFSSTGTVFRIQADGAFSVLHVFQGDFDGYDPQRLIQASDGNIYGTTHQGGFGSEGVVFRVDMMLCRDTLLAFWAPTSPATGSLNLGSTIHSWGPSTWSMWAVHAGGIVKLWALPIPAVSIPPISVTFAFLDVPQMGPIGFLTTLSTPAQGVMCVDWKIVDTGSPATEITP